MSQRKLLAIVSVEESKRVRCQYPGCGHPIYRSIHVVQDGSDLLLIGSTCITKDGFGTDLGEPAYTHGGGGGRLLSEEERQALIANTAELIARLKFEYESRTAASIPATTVVKQMHAAQNPPRKTPHESRSPAQWPWVDPSRSMLLLQMPDGSTWLRVQARSGKHHLMPFPVFDGWDEVLPPIYGQVNSTSDGYELSNLVGAIQYMRKMEPVVDAVCGSFSHAQHMTRKNNVEST